MNKSKARQDAREYAAIAGYHDATPLYGDFDRSPLRNDSPEMIFVAEKNE